VVESGMIKFSKITSAKIDAARVLGPAALAFFVLCSSGHAQDWDCAQRELMRYPDTS